jgi:hypothetical protein
MVLNPEVKQALPSHGASPEVDEVAQEWNEGSRAEPRRARRKQEPTEGWKNFGFVEKERLKYLWLV